MTTPTARPNIVRQSGDWLARHGDPTTADQVAAAITADQVAALAIDAARLDVGPAAPSAERLGQIATLTNRVASFVKLLHDKPELPVPNDVDMWFHPRHADERDQLASVRLAAAALGIEPRSWPVGDGTRIHTQARVAHDSLTYTVVCTTSVAAQLTAGA